jgi:hypothetical protein
MRSAGGNVRMVRVSKPRDRSRSIARPPPGPIDKPPPGPMDCPPPGPIDKPPPGPIDCPPPGPMDCPPPGPIESQPPGPMELGTQSRHACACPVIGINAKRHRLILVTAITGLKYVRGVFIWASLSKNLFGPTIIFAARLNY